MPKDTLKIAFQKLDARSQDILEKRFLLEGSAKSHTSRFSHTLQRFPRAHSSIQKKMP